VRLNPVISEEVDRAIKSVFPPCHDWTEVNVYGSLLRIVAIVSGRIFVGPELCHDEKYLDAAINYTLDLMAARDAVMALPKWLKIIRARSLPQVKKLDRRVAEADAILRPIVEARRKAEKEDAGYQKSDDMLQWLMDGQTKLSDRELAKMQLDLSFAAIHTTTLTATNVYVKTRT
jgi:cytochrome P450